MVEEDIFYSTRAAAEFLGVSERTIQRYRKDEILIPDGFGKNNSVLYSKKNLIQVVTRLLASGDTFLKNQPQVVTRYQKILEETSQVVTRSFQVVTSSEEQESEGVITLDSTPKNSNNTSRQNFSGVKPSVEIDYRTLNNSDATDLKYPENLALPTIPKYQYAMSMLQKGDAYLQGGIDTDCLKFRNGKLFFEDATGVLQRVSEVELQNFRTRESITKITGLPILRAFYTIFLTNYHDAIIKKEPLPKFIKIYVPDFINYIGLKRNSDKKTIDSIINQMSSFHNVIGVMEIQRNGREGKSYYPVLNFEGYDEKSNTIEVSSPYLFHVIEIIYQATLIIDKRSKQPKLKKNGEPLRLPSHSYVVKSSISSERNQAAVENVVIIVTMIEQAGDNTPHIKASTIIDRNSQFKERLEESKNPIQLLQRTFKRTWELLQEKTRLKDIYKDIQLPDPKDSKNIPTMKTLDMVFKFPHNGKCDDDKVGKISQTQQNNKNG